MRPLARALVRSVALAALAATAAAQAVLTDGTILVAVGEQGVLVDVPGPPLETFDGPPALVAPGVAEWLGVAYVGAAGPVELVGTGARPDWAGRRPLAPVAFRADAGGAVATAAGGELLVETRLSFDDDATALLGNVTLTNVGERVLRDVLVTREWSGAGPGWSFPPDIAVPTPLGPSIRRHVWMLDDLAPGASAAVGFSYRLAGAGDPVPGTAVDVPLSLWTDASWPGGLVVGETNGISFGDYDADGYTDIFACMEGALFRNLAGESWGPAIDLNTVLPFTNRRYGSSFGDYDDDGLPDIGTEPRDGWGGDECLHLLRNEGGGAFVDVATDPALVDVQACNSDSETICWADVDGDTRLDFVLPVYPAWAFGGPGNFFYYNLGPVGPGGETAFAEQSAPAGLDNPPGTARPEGAQFLDTDRDGDVDFYCNGTLYRNVSTPGNADFDAMLTADTGIQFSGDLEEGIVFFDVDLDGDQDFVGVWTSGAIGVRIHEARGDGSFALLPTSVVDSHTTGLNLGISAEDWDNDGDVDFTTRSVFRRNQLVETGALHFTVATTGIPSSHLTSATPAWGDWDHDGDLDCALGNWLSVGHFYQNDLYGDATPEADRRYVRVRVMRDSEAVPAGLETEYGATVEVDVHGDDARRVKFVSSSGGYLNQNEYVLHFALPPAPSEGEDDLVLDVVVDLADVPTNGYLRVDRHVNPVLGGIRLADLADREITVYRSGRVVLDGCSFEPAPAASIVLGTTTGGLVRPGPAAPVPPTTPAPGGEQWVGIELDTLAATEPVRLTELLLDGTLEAPVACGDGDAVVRVWDVTSPGSPAPVAGGALAPATSRRNDRSYAFADVVLEPGRTYRIVARVDRLRGTSVAAPVATGVVRVTGGLSYDDADPCTGAAAAAAAVDPSLVYLAARFREDAGAPFRDLGQALAGAGGAPVLAGTGALAPGTAFSVALAGAPPDAPGLLAIGISADCVPLVGGVVVPSLDVLQPFATDAGGAFALAGTWPAGLDPGVTFLAQAGVLDATAPAGVALSNALAAITQP